MSETKISYIAGYGRGGLAMLDTVLSNHTRIFGVGEVSDLWRTCSEEFSSSCSCGNDVMACPFGQQIFNTLKESDYNFAETLKLRQYCEGARPEASSQMQNVCYQGAKELLGPIWIRVGNADFIVDSSKRTRMDEGRPEAPRKPGDDVYVSHVVCDPPSHLPDQVRET